MSSDVRHLLSVTSFDLIRHPSVSEYHSSTTGTVGRPQ